MKRLLLIALLASCGSPSNGTVEDALVRQQVDKANAAGAKYGYKPIPYPVIEIMQRDPRCENFGSFMVEQEVTPGTNYDNDPNYDHDERLGHIRICAGGRFIEPNRIQVTREAIEAGYGVYYEAEHMVLFLNDRERYRATMYHTPETAHPIL